MSSSGSETAGIEGAHEPIDMTTTRERKRIVIVGLGMVALAFIEKLLKLDTGKKFTILVVGEEPHVAYNRVGLTSFFEHREVERLYLNPQSWYEDQKSSGGLNYLLSTRVSGIDRAGKTIETVSTLPDGSASPIVNAIPYDALIITTGSSAVLPTSTPGHNAEGVFVYRNIADLQNLITYSAQAPIKGAVGAVVGGGLLGLEAAKAMLDLENFGKVVLIDKNRWPLSRQLDMDAGMLVAEKIEELGVGILRDMRVSEIETEEVEGATRVKGVKFVNGERMDLRAICFAIGIKPRDELARKAGLECLDRGGILVNDALQTTDPAIYALGECACWNNQTYGLIAPGVEMADVLAHNLTQPPTGSPRAFRRPDLSTKLKLLGVDVASFGDYFADRDGPVELPGRRQSRVTDLGKEVLVKALTYKDPFAAVYKKYLFTPDGKYLLGGMMIGDTKDYVKLVAMVKNKKPLEVPPGEFILGSKKGDDGDGADELDDDTQVCSCHNVTKKDICEVVKDGSCKTLDAVKKCTKAGTGCAGCMPLVQGIFNSEMKKLGAEVSNHLCAHFPYSRTDLYNIITVKGLTTFAEVMETAGRDPTSLGCETCKPLVGSIFASTINAHVMSDTQHILQDTNDKFLANIQRNGSFSVIPRVAGGEITPDRLIVIGQIAKKYNLYCKITGGQRIDMFGARKEDLLDIWEQLIDAGMESGHAYAKSLRTIKSCVGTTWCRFGIGDSVGMAIRLENRYKSIRAPHKIKSGVSGCIRECAEAQNKDFGLIATEGGFNIFVAGNGGSKPRHSDLLIANCPPEKVIPILDRYLMFYIRTADRLQRTARWLENLPGGIAYLKSVILDDKLGICDSLEQQMSELVSTYFCEWTEVVRDPVKRAKFRAFTNPDAASHPDDNGIELVAEREQTRPAYWPAGSTTVDFKNVTWTSPLEWVRMVEASQLARPHEKTGIASCAVKHGDTQLAVFKVRGRYYATQQMCPHKRAFVLADGYIGDDPSAPGKVYVSCPQHKRNFQLTGADDCKDKKEGPNGGGAGACMNDDKLSVKMFEVEERDDGWVYLRLPSIEELDSVLGTKRWMVRKEESADPYEELDRRLEEERVREERRRALKGRKGVKTNRAMEGTCVLPKPVAVGGAGGGGGCGGGAADW